MGSLHYVMHVNILLLWANIDFRGQHLIVLLKRSSCEGKFENLKGSFNTKMEIMSFIYQDQKFSEKRVSHVEYCFTFLNGTRTKSWVNIINGVMSFFTNKNTLNKIFCEHNFPNAFSPPKK